MRFSSVFLITLSSLTLLAGMGSAGAQDTLDAVELQREVAAAHEEAVASSESLRDDLTAPVHLGTASAPNLYSYWSLSGETESELHHITNL